MKRFFPEFRKSFASLVALVFAAMLWTASANAQAPLKPVGGDFMSPGDAITTLNTEIGNISDQLQSSYNESLDYKLKFYNCIVGSLEEGQPVFSAVNDNFIRFVPGYTDQPQVEIPNAVPVAVWQGYYQEVTDLLQN